MENIGKHLQGGLAFTENDVASHATDLFRPIAQEVSMKESVLMNIPPNSMNQAGPYVFPITQRGLQYIQMNQIRLYMRAKITTDTGAAISDADGVGICNLMGNSMFNTIEVEIGGKSIPELQNTHSNYKAYLETFLSYGVEAKSSHLQASLWRADDADEFDDCKYGTNEMETNNANKVKVYNNTKNVGLESRRTIIKGGRTFDLMFPLHCDFFNSDRLLPPGVQMNLKLTRGSDNFVFMNMGTTKTFKIVLSNMMLVVPYITVAESITAHHMKRIQTEPIILPIKKTEILTHYVVAGATNVNLASQFQNRIPKTLIIGMLATASYNGDPTTNPYNFKHFDVSHVCIKRNGVTIPSEPYTPDWDAKLFMREYRAFFDNTGVGTDNIGSPMTPKLFQGGATLFAFDLTPDHCNGIYFYFYFLFLICELDLNPRRGDPPTKVSGLFFF